MTGLHKHCHFMSQSLTESKQIWRWFSLAISYTVSLMICFCFRMSLLDQHQPPESDHNMNSSQGQMKEGGFPGMMPGFPRFPFLAGLQGLSQDSLPTVPVSLQLTGQLEDSSPKSTESESSRDSPKSSPSTGKLPSKS